MGVGLKLCWVVVSIDSLDCIQNFRPLETGHHLTMSKKILSNKFFWVKQILLGVKKIFLGQTNFLGQKTFLVKGLFWSTKTFWSKNFLGLKTFLAQKTFLGQKRFWVKNIFGSKTYLGQQKFRV